MKFAGSKFSSRVQVTTLLQELRSTLFDAHGVPTVDFIDSCGWEEMFGQLCPDTSKHTESARAMVNLATVCDNFEKSDGIVKALIKHYTKIVQRSFRKEHSGEEGVAVDYVGGALMMRFQNRIPAQRFHFDSGSEKFGEATELSLIVAISQQRSVVFLDLPSATRPIPFVSPFLETGDAVAFNASEAAHFGGSLGRTIVDEVVVSAIFLNFQITSASNVPAPAIQGKVDMSADKFLFSEIEQPVVVKCVCCEHPVHNRVGALMCSSCVKEPPGLARTGSHFGDMPWVVCAVCCDNAIEGLSYEDLANTRKLYHNNSVMNFMVRSCAGEGYTKLCSHPVADRVDMDVDFVALLYFRKEELVRSAAWLMRLLLNNSLISGSVTESIVDLESLCNHVGQGCERKARLADLMLRAIGVEFVSRPVLGSLSLLFRDVDETYESTLFKRLTHLSDIIERLLRPAPDVQELSRLVARMMRTAEVKGVVFGLCCSHLRSSEFVNCWPEEYDLSRNVKEGFVSEAMMERSALLQEELTSYIARSSPSVYELIQVRM